MSKSKNPIDVLAAGQEDSYHRRRDEALIEQLRSQMKRSQTAADLQTQTQITDEALLTRIAALGITAESIAIVHLLPLLDVAWSDGQIQESERYLLIDAAEATGVHPGPAREKFEQYLSTPPPRELVAAATDFIAQLLWVLPDGEREAVKSNLVDYAWRVADACGGVFGLWGRVEETEKAALRRIADSLANGHEDASNALLKRL